MYSLIVPIYNEEDNIPVLYERLKAVMDQLASTELVLINDGSGDRSLEMIRALHDQDKRVCYLSFARNLVIKWR